MQFLFQSAAGNDALRRLQRRRRRAVRAAAVAARRSGRVDRRHRHQARHRAARAASRPSRATASPCSTSRSSRNRDALERLLAAGVTVAWYDHHAPGPHPVAPAPDDAHRHRPGDLHQRPRRRALPRPLPRLGGRGGLRRQPAARGRAARRHACAGAGRARPVANARRGGQLQRVRRQRGRRADPPGRAVPLARALRRSLRGDGERVHRARTGRAAARRPAPRARSAAAAHGRSLHGGRVARRGVEPARAGAVRERTRAARSAARACGAEGGSPTAATRSACARRSATLRGAAELAREFGGGGRAAAAGIDRLPEDELPRFIARLAAAWRAG